MLLSKSRRLLVNPSKSERRTWDRLPVQFRVFCRNARKEDELWWSACVMDLSRGGVRLFSPHGFEPSTLIRIGEADAAEELAEFLEALVVRAQPSLGAKWTLGCSLTKELSRAELLTWYGSLGWV
jgi:hypothetical protein